MKTFSQYITEDTVVLSEAAMTASGAKAEDHLSKYLKPEQLKTLKYTMAKHSGGAKEGEEVKIKKIVATPTMGGGTAYHAHITHSKGNAVVPINHIMKPAGVGRAGGNAEEKEDKAVAGLHKQITDAVAANGGKSIKIKHLGKTYNIAGARKVVSDDFSGRKPKGDIILHDENGKSHIFLSHKAGAKATQAQNYEGLSGHGEHPQVSKFIEDLKKANPKGLTNGQSFVRRFTTTKKADKHLHKAVMFGSDHDSTQRSVHNVHSIAHGDIGISAGPRGVHTLTSDKFIHNDESFNHNEHPVEFTARFMNQRKDNGVANARIGIARVGSRPTSKEM